ncbi:MAG: hypothetical protein RL637_888, partial [Pseudomonadota bacterium]
VGCSNSIGSDANSNVKAGTNALLQNTTGSENVSIGDGSLLINSGGSANTAVGTVALYANTTGNNNTGIGWQALRLNNNGSNNTALGYYAGKGIVSGNDNVAIGYNAGLNLTTGSNNIYLGEVDVSSATESNTIHIGNNLHTQTWIGGIYGQGTSSGISVYIDSAGKLGTISSSQRYKTDIQDMGNNSSILMKLRPVTFHYKPKYDDGKKLLQYGLIAEEVYKVLPDLVAKNAKGEIETVRYQFLPPMLLHEYQRQQRTIEAQAKLIQQQSQEIAHLKKQESVNQQQDLKIQQLQNQINLLLKLVKK